MNILRAQAIIVGLLFGIWPLILRKSGATGNVSSFVFSMFVALVMLPFALPNISDVRLVSWKITILAATMGAIGLLFFNGMLAKASSQTAGQLFVLMIIVQTAVPAIHQIMAAGSLPGTKGVGLVLAVIAAILLTI